MVFDIFHTLGVEHDMHGLAHSPFDVFFTAERCEDVGDFIS